MNAQLASANATVAKRGYPSSTEAAYGDDFNTWTSESLIRWSPSATGGIANRIRVVSRLPPMRDSGEVP